MGREYRAFNILHSTQKFAVNTDELVTGLRMAFQFHEQEYGRREWKNVELWMNPRTEDFLHYNLDMRYLYPATLIHIGICKQLRGRYQSTLFGKPIVPNIEIPERVIYFVNPRHTDWEGITLPEVELAVYLVEPKPYTILDWLEIQQKGISDAKQVRN
jgi:hypothetical protein